MIRKLIISLVAASFIGCSATIPNAVFTGAAYAGTTSVLRLTIKDDATRTAVANWADYIAIRLRTVTGAPTIAQLTALINSTVPPNIQSDIPELLAFVTPYVTAEYKKLYDKYATTGNAAKINAGLNAIAIGIENGCAPYISH